LKEYSKIPVLSWRTDKQDGGNFTPSHDDGKAFECLIMSKMLGINIKERNEYYKNIVTITLSTNSLIYKPYIYDYGIRQYEVQFTLKPCYQIPGSLMQICNIPSNNFINVKRIK
jgi:hypothetical protein